jgi:hypothetical protein
MKPNWKSFSTSIRELEIGYTHLHEGYTNCKAYAEVMAVGFLDWKGCPRKQQKCCTDYASNVNPTRRVRYCIEIVRI